MGGVEGVYPLMPNLRLEVIVPKEGIADVPRLMRVVENTLNEQAEAVRQQFLNTIETWNHRPTFLIRRSPGVREIFTVDKIYAYVSQGTRPHVIRPKNAKALHFFRTGFRAKSRVRMISRSNKGHVATKDETYTQLVHHPGTQAREFAEAIQEKWQKELPTQMQRAIDSEFGR